MDISESAAGGTRPVDQRSHDELVEPFMAATRTALAEMASTELVVRTIGNGPLACTPGEVAVLLRFVSTTVTAMVLRFPERTATALTTRMLAGVRDNVDETLIRDCVGEIANVVAGQAKALLTDTPYRFAFSVPEVSASTDEFRSQPDPGCPVIVFNSDQGEFALQLLLKP